jgi:hypothetical protein
MGFMSVTFYDEQYNAHTYDAVDRILMVFDAFILFWAFLRKRNMRWHSPKKVFFTCNLDGILVSNTGYRLY